MGESNAPLVMMVYMTTRIAAVDKGLTIEYIAKRNGSVQFDSICHPNHAAILNERVNTRSFDGVDFVITNSISLVFLDFIASCAILSSPAVFRQSAFTDRQLFKMFQQETRAGDKDDTQNHQYDDLDGDRQEAKCFSGRKYELAHRI